VTQPSYPGSYPGQQPAPVDPFAPPAGYGQSPAGQAPYGMAPSGQAPQPGYAQPAPTGYVQSAPGGYPAAAPSAPPGYQQGAGYPSAGPSAGYVQPAAGYGYTSAAPASPAVGYSPSGPAAGYPPGPAYAPAGSVAGYGGQAPAGYAPSGAPQATNYPAAGYTVPGGQAQQLVCRFCGCVPAVDTTFRGHRGMIVIMQFRSSKGPFCRDCGLASFRRMTANTMWQGWWGYASFIITPFTILINLFRRGKVASLPAPQPNPNGRSQRPADPGPPLLARPGAIVGLLIPVALLVIFIAAVASSSTS